MSITIEEIKNKLKTFNESLDVQTLDDDEKSALDSINGFWNGSRVYEYQKTMDVDRFYDMKVFHTVLNGKYRNNATDIEIKWTVYIQTAMSHRVSLLKKKRDINNDFNTFF